MCPWLSAMRKKLSIIIAPSYQSMQNVLTSTQPMLSQIISVLSWFPDSVGITAAARWILLYFCLTFRKRTLNTVQLWTLIDILISSMKRFRMKRRITQWSNYAIILYQTRKGAKTPSGMILLPAKSPCWDKHISWILWLLSQGWYKSIVLPRRLPNFETNLWLHIFMYWAFFTISVLFLSK